MTFLKRKVGKRIRAPPQFLKHNKFIHQSDEHEECTSYAHILTLTQANDLLEAEVSSLTRRCMIMCVSPSLNEKYSFPLMLCCMLTENPANSCRELTGLDLLYLHYTRWKKLGKKTSAPINITSVLLIMF